MASASIRAEGELQGRPPEIRSVTGLRAVAAFAVVVFHFRWHVASVFPAFTVLEPWTSAGRYGVDLFFIVSGFILTYMYAASFREIRLAAYLRFLGLRLARIYPLHLFTIAVLIVAVVGASLRGITINHSEQFTLPDLAFNLLLLHGWTLDQVVSWNYPSWSISAEWAAYLAFPLIAWWVVRLRSARAAITAAAGTLAIQLVTLPLLGLNQDFSPVLRISGEFIAGALLGRLYLLGWGAGRRWDLVVLAVPAVIAVFLAFVPAEDLVGRRAIIPLLAVLLFAVARSTTWPASWLSSRWMVFWGEASYAVYMTHALVEISGAKFAPMSAWSGAPAIVRVGVVAAYVAVILAVAAGAHLLVERPSRTALRRLLLRPAGAALPRGGRRSTPA